MRSIMQNGNIVYLLEREPRLSKAGFHVSHPGQLLGEEGPHWLDANRLRAAVPPGEEALIEEGRARAVNMRHPAAERLVAQPSALPAGKKRVHIVALGDVGATLLLGLKLLGGDDISEIGVFDMRENIAERYEFEMNQISDPFCSAELPGVEPVAQEDLFRCDVFVFCASRGVPEVGTEVRDVRMAQLAGNIGILRLYARMARDTGFMGLFCVVSDPVDLLCQYAYMESNRTDTGDWDDRGLLPEQVRGYGLGVMHARAAYYAKKDARFLSYLTEGRMYGPHGQGIVAANSVPHYDDALSGELTALTLSANLRLREIGFKPYIAPAVSSGVLPILATLRGEWHYSAVALGGAYFGCKNRLTPNGAEIEALPLPEELYGHICESHAALIRQGKTL